MLSNGRCRLDDLPAKCQLSGVAINRVPEEEVEQFKADVTAMLGQVDVPVAAVLPFNSSFKNIRVNEASPRPREGAVVLLRVGCWPPSQASAGCGVVAADSYFSMRMGV